MRTRGNFVSAATARRAGGDRSAAMESSTRDAREAREARARLYGATVTFADKKRLAETLVSGLGGADGASRAGAGDGHAATHGPATAAVLSEWALATLAWAGLAADITDRGPRLGGEVIAGSGARGGSGGGGASKKPAKEKKPSAPPPRAVGVDAPDAASICADADVWRVLVAALDATQETPSASTALSYKPNATAATHVVRAAAAAATAAAKSVSNEPTESLFALAAACLDRFERRLGAKFKPSVEQSVVLVHACVRLGCVTETDETENKKTRGSSALSLTNEAFRLWTRSVRAAPHRAPAAAPNEALDAALARAAREREARDGSETPALNALAAVLFHPSHREHVPAAFGRAAGDGDGATRAGTKRAPREEETKHETTAGDDGDAAPEDVRRLQPPPETVQLVASRILTAACAGEAVGALAPWVFRAFAEEEATRAAGAAARGGVASTSGEAASAAAAARREAPTRALWDALFAPIARAEVERRGGSSYASDLIVELGRAGLYSQTAAGGGLAPPGGAAPRDRLECFAAGVFGGGASRTSGGVSGDAAARALRALVATDLRLVEPRLSEAFAATWSAGTLTDALAAETVAAAVAAYAATRRIPECLAAVGAAAASLSASKCAYASASGIERARVFAAPAVLAAGAAAGARVPPGQIAAVVAAARDAVSAAFVEPTPATEASGSKKAKNASSAAAASSPAAAAAERVAATCAFVATIVSSLPVAPGEPLADGARAALEGFARDLAGVAGAWSDVPARERNDESKKEKKRKRDRDARDDERDEKRLTSSRDAIGAARVGAALVAYVPVAAMLEVCHDGEELHGRWAAPYLAAGAEVPLDPLAPSLARVAATALRLGGDVGAREIGAGVAGACVHRIAQLARSALPPPAGRGDAGAAEEAKALAEVLTSPDALATASAVAALRSAEDVWTPWAEPARLAAWTRARSIKADEADDDDDDDAPEVLAARVAAAARGALAAARDAAATRGGALAALCARAVDAAASRLDSSLPACDSSLPDASDSSRVLRAFWLQASAEANQEKSLARVTSDSANDDDDAKTKTKTKTKTRTNDASLASLEASLARLASVPAALAARAADPAALLFVAAASDCAARLVAGHASTSASCAARAFASALADADAAAARELVAFLPPLVADAVSAAESTETRKIAARVVARSTAAAASMARAALSRGDDLSATRDVAAALAPAVRVLAAEAEGEKARRGEVNAAEPESAVGMVPRAARAKRKKGSRGSDAELSVCVKNLDPPAARLTLGAARAAALAEATLVAALACVPAASEEARRERARDARVGAAAIRARRETRALREAVDAAVASLRDAGGFSRAFAAANESRLCDGLLSGDSESIPSIPDEAFVSAAASALSAAGASARLAELCARHADERALRDDPPDADATRVCVTTSAETLALFSSSFFLSDAKSARSAESAAVAAATATAACVGLMDATGPALDANAHAALLATVVAAYDAAARRAEVSSAKTAKETETAKNGFFFTAPELPAPSPRLARALESALESLTRGAGKRPLGAGYRAAVERLRDVDAACRRLSHGSGDPNAIKETVSARDVAARVAAPLWLLRFFLRLNGGAAKAACAAHAETAFDACLAPARHVNDHHLAFAFSRDVDAACREEEEEKRRFTMSALATAGASVRFAVALAAKRGVALSARCASRMAAAPSSLAATLAPTGSLDGATCYAACVSVFVPACDLLTQVLRTRKEEMKRSAALIVASCAALLDALRAWHEASVALRRKGDDEKQNEKKRRLTNATDDDFIVIDSACRRGGAALACVYEEACSSGLNRYCAHLLADAVTCVCGGDAGVGPFAAASLKPGMFALIDACGDRELGQIHAAFGSQAGGARRVALAALIEEHKRAHKYDGKV